MQIWLKKYGWYWLYTLRRVAAGTDGRGEDGLVGQPGHQESAEAGRELLPADLADGVDRVGPRPSMPGLGGWPVAASRWRNTVASIIPPRMLATHVVL